MAIVVACICCLRRFPAVGVGDNRYPPSPHCSTSLARGYEPRALLCTLGRPVTPPNSWASHFHHHSLFCTTVHLLVLQHTSLLASALSAIALAWSLAPTCLYQAICMHREFFCAVRNTSAALQDFQATKSTILTPSHTPSLLLGCHCVPCLSELVTRHLHFALHAQGHPHCPTPRTRRPLHSSLCTTCYGPCLLSRSPCSSRNNPCSFCIASRLPPSTCAHRALTRTQCLPAGLVLACLALQKHARHTCACSLLLQLLFAARCTLRLHNNSTSLLVANSLAHCAGRCVHRPCCCAPLLRACSLLLALQLLHLDLASLHHQPYHGLTVGLSAQA